MRVRGVRSSRFNERSILVCWDGYRGRLGGRMILCGYKSSGDSEVEGAGVGCPPSLTDIRLQDEK